MNNAFRFLFVLTLLILASRSYSQCDSSYVFCDQMDVDSFQVWYGPCDRVNSIELDSQCAITNLDGLKNIKWINNLLFYKNSANHLESISGLDSLTRINNFTYHINKFFPGAFPSLETVSILWYSMTPNNPDLRMLRNVRNLFNVFINGDGQLEGLRNLQISQNLRISILSNQVATHFDSIFIEPIDSVTEVALTNLNGIDVSAINNIKTLGALVLSRNRHIDFSTLKDLQIGYSLFCENDQSSCNFEGAFLNVESLRYLNIEGTKSIHKIEDLLPNLKSIKEGIKIVNNDSISSLEHIADFDLPYTDKVFRSFLFPNYVEVSGNPNLEVCDNRYICRVLINHPDSTVIENNGVLCNEDYLRSSGCLTHSPKEEEAFLDIYPNPVYQTLHIKAKNIPFKIHSLTGKVVLSGIVEDGAIHVQQLSSGMYQLSLKNGENWIHTKFMKVTE